MRTRLLQNLFYDKTGVFRFAILSSPLFYFGLVVKLYASALFTSDYFSNLFVPFAKYAIITSSDPYLFFFSLGIPEAFPYPSVMLFILALPGLLFPMLLSGEIFYHTHGELLLFHLPILVADIVILLVLSRWLRHHHKLLLLLYWLSPVLFYINYLHSQLDAIPIAFVFLFLHFLFKEKWLVSALCLAAGIATKFHLIVVVPFALLYLLRKRGLSLQTLFLFPLVLLGSFILANLDQLGSSAFLTMVFANQAQSKILNLTITFGTHILYVAPAAYALLVLHALTFKRFNRDVFVMFLGFAFGILTLFITPMPGWYYWTLPFFIYFAIRSTYPSRILLGLLSLGYFLYFALTPTSDFLTLFAYSFPTLTSNTSLYTIITNFGLPADFLSSLAFTGLQACLLANVFAVYRFGIESSKQTKLFNMPFLIGIAGDSGSGKTTLTKLLTDIFGHSEVATVEGDALHRWERGNEMWQTYTHLDPKANALHEEIEHMLRLRNGDDTYRRHYDHNTGTFTSAERLQSKKLVVFEGLHSFYLTSMQNALDLKVFIMPEEQLRTHWKLLRDVGERGYNKERVLEQLQKREHDSLEYISSQRDYADIVFTLRSDRELGNTIGCPQELTLFLEIECSNAINVDPLLAAFSSRDLHIEHRFAKRLQTLRFRGSISTEDVRTLSITQTPELYEITLREPLWASGYNGVMQLFLCYYIFESLRTTTRYGNNP